MRSGNHEFSVWLLLIVHNANIRFLVEHAHLAICLDLTLQLGCAVWHISRSQGLRLPAHLVRTPDPRRTGGARGKGSRQQKRLLACCRSLSCVNEDPCRGGRCLVVGASYVHVGRSVPADVRLGATAHRDGAEKRCEVEGGGGGRAM